MTQPDIRRPVVAGAGTMGTTLARIFAQHGFAVTLWNRRTPSLERAQTRIAGDLDRLAAQGLLTEDPAAIARRVTYTTDYAAFDGADFVVENIAEDLAVKQAFFRAISPRVAPEALLTTNTSGLRVTDVAQGVEDPTRFCGMHWWNPPDLMPLVEITRGDQTSQAAAQAVHALALALGKKPVIVQKDILGILGNRLQYAVMREALHILATGAAGPEEIDAAMKYGPGFRYAVLGPFETADLGGVDIFQAVSDYLFPDLNNDQRSQALHDLVDQGRLGVKAGDGFYRYAPGQGEAARQRRDALPGWERGRPSGSSEFDSVRSQHDGRQYVQASHQLPGRGLSCGAPGYLPGAERQAVSLRSAGCGGDFRGFSPLPLHRAGGPGEGIRLPLRPV